MQINTAVFHKSQHLDESKLELFDSKCPFCGNTNRQQVYRLQETPEVLLLQCNACHAMSASLIPTDEALTEFYGGYYDPLSLETTTEQVTFDAPERLAKNLADMYFRDRSDTSVSILDYGGGDGTISHLTAMQLIKRGAAHVNITAELCCIK